MKDFCFTQFALRMLEKRWELSDSQIYELAGNFINMRSWSISHMIRYANSMQRVMRWLRKDGRIIEVSRKTLDDWVSEDIFYKLPIPLVVTTVGGGEVKEEKMNFFGKVANGIVEDWEKFKSIFKD